LTNFMHLLLLLNKDTVAVEIGKRKLLIPMTGA